MGWGKEIRREENVPKDGFEPVDIHSVAISC